jgi:FkbM family methyltransferase
MYLDSDRIPLEELKWGIRAHFKGWKYVGDHWELEYGKFNVKFKYMIFSIYEVFNDEIYKSDFKDKEVVDIGANVGDSAIWFALNGAKKVVAIEPYPFPYNIMLMNIKENNFSDRILALNCGVGKEKYKIRVTTEPTFRDSDLKASEKGVEISVYQLDYLIEKFGPFDVLKTDCEGCEYDTILNSQNIRDFKQIQLEYHYGCEELKIKLENLGFNVKCTKPVPVYSPHAKKPKMAVGYLYALK